MRKLNPDALNSVPLRETGRAAMQVIDSLQRFDEEVQIVAAGCVFQLLCKRFDKNPQDLFTIVGNLMDESVKVRPELRAVGAYLEEELSS